MIYCFAYESIAGEVKVKKFHSKINIRTFMWNKWNYWECFELRMMYDIVVLKRMYVHKVIVHSGAN